MAATLPPVEVADVVAPTAPIEDDTDNTTPDLGDDVPPIDPTVKTLLDHMQAANIAASQERQAQTAAFTTAIEGLGSKFESKMDAQTQAMSKAAYLATGIVVLALTLLGSIAGAVTYYRAGDHVIGVGRENAAPKVDAQIESE